MTGLGRTLWTVVATAALGGVLLSLVVLTGPHRSTPDVVEVRGRAAVGAPTPPTWERVAGYDLRRRGSVVRVSRASADLGRGSSAAAPVLATSVRIPSLDIELGLRATGVDRDGQMVLPADPAVLGWYRYGPAPGRPGSAVLAGHVDSVFRGVGPLAVLAGVRPGARVLLDLPSGRRAIWRVDSVETFDRQALPAEVFARTGPPRLRLITCTGEFDPAVGGYQQNLVVTAVPVASRA